jgi:hypothetical protein
MHPADFRRERKIKKWIAEILIVSNTPERSARKSRLLLPAMHQAISHHVAIGPAMTHNDKYIRERFRA